MDYDNDGKLDLFVTNYLDWSFATSRVCGAPDKRLSCSPSLYKGEPNILYHNNGDGTFTDVSESMGISKHIGKGMGIAIADYDDDGWMDIFVANDNEQKFSVQESRRERIRRSGRRVFRRLHRQRYSSLKHGGGLSRLGQQRQAQHSSDRPGRRNVPLVSQ